MLLDLMQIPHCTLRIFLGSLIHLLSLGLSDFQDAVFEQQAPFVILGMERLEGLVLVVEQADCDLNRLMLSLCHPIGMAQAVPVLESVLAPVLGGGDVFLRRNT